MLQNDVKQDIVGRLIDKEWFFFGQVNNIGGRASCQDDFMTFRIMRSSQFETWDEEVLLSYERDLKQAEAAGRGFGERRSMEGRSSYDHTGNSDTGE